VLGVLFIYGVSLPTRAVAGTEPANHEAPAAAPIEQGIMLLPSQALYPRYIADPHEVSFSAQIVYVASSDIPQTSVQRYIAQLGGFLPLIEAVPGNGEEPDWQLGIAAGVNGQFDVIESTDNLGWDGIMHLETSFRSTPTRIYKVAWQHLSSHVGDEYAERTGRQRIAYTRNELAGGISERIGDRWRAYGEIGWGYSLKNDDLQEPGRVQGGLEFELPRRERLQYFQWYGAMDLSAMQESAWKPNVSLQLGLALHRNGRRLRAALEFYRGDTPIREYFQSDESYVGTGLWLDI